MLPAPPPRQPSQKRPAVQWDMGGLLDTEHARMKSMSPQAGIKQRVCPNSPSPRGGSSMETVCIIRFRNAERLQVTISRYIIALCLALHRFGCSVT